MSDFGDPRMASAIAEGRKQALEYEENKGDYVLLDEIAAMYGVDRDVAAAMCRSKTIPAIVTPDGWALRKRTS